MTKEEKEKIIEAAQQNPILMPDGGHCCLRMTDNCYGCACYSLGTIGRCHDRIQTYWEEYGQKTKQIEEKINREILEQLKKDNPLPIQKLDFSCNSGKSYNERFEDFQANFIEKINDINKIINKAAEIESGAILVNEEKQIKR